MQMVRNRDFFFSFFNRARFVSDLQANCLHFKRLVKEGGPCGPGQRIKKGRREKLCHRAKGGGRGGQNKGKKEREKRKTEGGRKKEGEREREREGVVNRCIGGRCGGWK